MKPLQAPFPWLGGKSRVAKLVWERFGDVGNYVEPFFGSGAVLLGRPRIPNNAYETVNDIDGFIANFWRSVAASADETLRWADGPTNEADLHARHIWLVNQREEFTARIMGDPEYHDPKVAGWWVWGISCWIGGNWCEKLGPWNRDGEGRICKVSTGLGVQRRIPNMWRRNGTHCESNREKFGALQTRLRNVRVACGDWSRVLGPSCLPGSGATGIFLDPPYEGFEDVYGSANVSSDVRKWAIENGEDPELRIAVCGYEGEHEFPENWEKVEWKTAGGYARRNKDSENFQNRTRERIWFSPHCLRANQGVLL